MKKSILIVDDDTELCAELGESFAKAGSVEVTAVHDGHRAMTLLMDRTFDLVVTDLQMPRMDGFALIAYMTRHAEETPFLVITAHDTNEVEELSRQIGISRFIRKPFAMAEFQSRIFDLLSACERGVLTGISIGPFLQLLEMERKTCTLTVTHDGEVGMLYIAYGALFDAQTANNKGELAAMKIIGWDSDIKIQIEDICRSSERTVNRDLRFLIMESLRHADEVAAGAEGSGEIDLSALEDLEFSAAGPDDREPSPLERISDDDRESISTYLNSLWDIKGVLGSGIVNTRGEILVSVLHDKDLDFDQVCRSYGEYVPSPFKTPEEHVHETVFRSADHVVVVQSVGKHAWFGFHLVVVISQESAEGLLKIRLRRLMPKLMAKLYSSESSESFVPPPPE